MEKGPEFRIIGNVSEETKKEKKEELRKYLYEGHFDDVSEKDLEELNSLEYDKSEIEKILISFANQETNLLMEEAGVSSYDVPERNFHIVPPELFKKASGGFFADAITVYGRQTMVFDAQNFRHKPLYFGSVAFHELLHLKGHLSTEVQPKQNGEGFIDTPYREGVGVRALQKKGKHGEYYEYFRGLHEAIVSAQQKKIFDKILNLPEFKKEKERLNSQKTIEAKRKISQEKNILEENIMWVNEQGNNYECFPYPKQREVLNFLMEEIQKENSDDYSHKEDVLKEFLKAHFTGQLLTIARLIETTFGKGTFRILGTMDGEKDSAVRIKEILRKARLQKI